MAATFNQIVWNDFVVTDNDVYMIEQLQKAGQKKEACMKFLNLILRRESEEERLDNANRLINAFREEGISSTQIKILLLSNCIF